MIAFRLTRGRSGEMGDTVMVSIPIAVSIMALFVSMGSLVFTIWKGRYDQVTGVRPTLVFAYNDVTGWELQNIGSGPALNIVIALKEHGVDSKSGKWTKPVRIPPMKKDGSFHLHWDPFNNTHGLGATYEDMWERPYTTTCGRDLNQIRRGRYLAWQESEIKAEWALRKS
jgi:hypothetical protein